MRDFIAKQIAKLLGIEGVVGMKLPTSITVAGIKVTDIQTDRIGGGIGVTGFNVCGVPVELGYDD